MNVLRLLFWEWRRGRVGRTVFMACSVAISAALYSALLLLPLPLEEKVEFSGGNSSVLVLSLIGTLGLLALFGSLNLAAKRFRDIGAPGWTATIGVTVLNGALVFLAPGLTYPWFSILVFSVLALTPSRFLSSRT